MRPLQLLLPLLTWVSLGLAQDAGLVSAIENLPPCALSCLTTAIAQSPCDLTDTTCVCNNAKLQTNVEGCVMKSCTVKQSLTTKNITSTLCHAPIRNKGESIRVGNIVLTVVTNFIAWSRIAYKVYFTPGDLAWDDYLVITSLIIGVPSVAIVGSGIVPSGLGRDIWTLPFDQITEFGRWLYVLEVLYFFQLAVVKLSLLFFCLRIFPKPIIRRLLWATIAFDLVWGTAFVILAIFQCRPIDFYWTKWDKEKQGQCVNANTAAWSNAIISIVLDIWMLSLPLYEVFQLQLTWRKKASVALMFSVGSFITIVSILRLQSLVSFARSTNPTFDQTQVVNWSNIEVNVGIICACLPTWRVMLVRFFPKIFGGSTKGSSHGYYASGSRSQGKEKGGSALGSGKGRGTGGKDPHAITYTTTFDIEHGENDETLLVQMNDFEAKGPERPKVQSTSTSISSL